MVGGGEDKVWSCCHFFHSSMREWRLALTSFTSDTCMYMCVLTSDTCMYMCVLTICTLAGGGAPAHAL